MGRGHNQRRSAGAARIIDPRNDAGVAGNFATIVFDVVVSPDVPDGTVISNQAFVSAALGGVADQPSDDRDGRRVGVARPAAAGVDVARVDRLHGRDRRDAAGVARVAPAIAVGQQGQVEDVHGAVVSDLCA